MPAINFVDRVKETSVSTGTGDFTLAGAVTGYQTFDAAFGHAGNYFYYCIEAVDGNGVPTGQWETGEGHLSASTTLVRDTLLASSTGSAVSFSAGTKNVFCTVAAQYFANPKRYFAKLTQSGTSAPSATELHNNLGVTVNWNYNSVGTYTSDSLGAGDLTANYSGRLGPVIIGNRMTQGYAFFGWNEDDDFTYCQIKTYEATANDNTIPTGQNGLLENTLIEIFYYE